MWENVPRRKRREAEAMRWFRQAAHHGQASSWFHIGSHYERGLGVDKDPAKAAEAYRNGRGKRVLRRPSRRWAS